MNRKLVYKLMYDDQSMLSRYYPNTNQKYLIQQKLRTVYNKIEIIVYLYKEKESLPKFKHLKGLNILEVFIKLNY